MKDDEIVKEIQSKINCLEMQYDELDKIATTDKILYHYTNVCAALNILSNREFWLTSYLDLTDGKEFNLPDQIVHDFTINNNCKEIMIFKKTYFDFRAKLGAYVLSFCTSNKNEKLWENYATQRQGCVLGLRFPPSFYYKGVVRSQCVIYEGADNGLYKKFYSDCTQFLTNCFNIEKKDRFFLPCLVDIVCFMLASAPRFKKGEFVGEKEYRLFIHDLDPFIPEKNIPNQIKVKIGDKDRCILKLEGMIDDIILMPGKYCKMKKELNGFKQNSFHGGPQK